MHSNNKCSDPNFNKDNDEEAAHIIVANQNMQRNVRCVLAYLSERMTRIERLAWEGGKHIPTHILDNMSESEMQYFKKYLDNEL